MKRNRLNKLLSRNYLYKNVNITNLLAIVLAIFLLYGCSPNVDVSIPPTDAAPATSTASATPVLNVAAALPTILPADVSLDPTLSCTVDDATFASWFKSSNVTLDGLVNPADSVNFPHDGNCSFYKWSEQMFLWLTSPISPSDKEYQGNGHVFDSQIFYDVLPPDASGIRTLKAHVPGGEPLSFVLREDQLGSHNLPVITDITGKLFEVLPPANPGSEKAPVLNQEGQQVEAAEANVGNNGNPIFLDSAGKEITGVKPIIPSALSNANIIQEFLVDGKRVFLDANGNVIETDVNVEQGQAGGNAVLQAQNKSLVYYSIAVNDVFAYFLTGAKTGKITLGPTPQFPTTINDLAPIATFAAVNQAPITIDPNALAVEIKMAWVEAEGLQNLDQYITTMATIPTYDMQDGYFWPQKSEKTTKMALVGVHVVGSAAGHPEMIWSTFEHVNNTPLAEYTYINTQGQTITVDQHTGGNWTFSANDSKGPFNVERMMATPAVNGTPAHIAALTPRPKTTTPMPIGPSDTIRWKAWGAAANALPNPLVTSVAQSNTEVIAINVSVIGKLISGDVRTNYLFTGSTWTIGGAAPTGSFSFNPAVTPTPAPTPVVTPGNEVGTSLLNNTTMETYKQGSDNTTAKRPNTLQNCFSCHNGNPPNNFNNTNSVYISHIYDSLMPLFGVTVTPTITPTLTPTPTPTSTP